MAYINGKEVLFSPQIIKAEVSSEDYEQGFEDGKNSVEDLVKYAKIVQLVGLGVFNKSTVELNLDNATDLTSLIAPNSTVPTNTTVEHLIINCPNLIARVGYMVGSGNNPDNVLKRITLNVNTEKSTSFNTAFSTNRALEIIDGMPLDFSSSTTHTNTFMNCGKLKELRIKPNTVCISLGIPNCPLLSDESVQSIIDGLVDLTGAETQTLTFNKTVGNNLTDEQKATITAKNWTLAY